MKSKSLPNYPKTSAVIRAGIRDITEPSILRHCRLIARAALTWSGTRLIEKVISVPESQIDAVRFHLQSFDLYGFTCLPRPDSRNFGDDQEFNERCLIENPGQIAISDADFGFCIENPRASYKLTPDQFGAEFEDASRLAAYNRVKFWGFSYRQSQGPFIGRQGMHSSVSTKDDGFVRSSINKSLGGFFIRNLMIFSNKAKGVWGSCPLLEELYRALSEFSHDPESLGRYYGTRVRFPDTRTNKDYHKHPDWLKGKDIIYGKFPIKLVNQFKDVLCREHNKNRDIE